MRFPKRVFSEYFPHQMTLERVPFEIYRQGTAPEPPASLGVLGSYLWRQILTEMRGGFNRTWIICRRLDWLRGHASRIIKNRLRLQLVVGQCVQGGLLLLLGVEDHQHSRSASEAQAGWQYPRRKTFVDQKTRFSKSATRPVSFAFIELGSKMIRARATTPGAPKAGSSQNHPPKPPRGPPAGAQRFSAATRPPTSSPSRRGPGRAKDQKSPCAGSLARALKALGHQCSSD
jgi:hypothetical protein